MIDYGNNGQINEVDCDTVQEDIDEILEYVESRFDILDAQNRQEDIMALCQEFYEWGSAGEGDDIGYLYLPRLANCND
jgi:hypothetical protein